MEIPSVVVMAGMALFLLLDIVEKILPVGNRLDRIRFRGRAETEIKTAPFEVVPNRSQGMKYGRKINMPFTKGSVSARFVVVKCAVTVDEMDVTDLVP